MTANSKPSKIIKIDKHTNKIALPTILLQNRSFDTIGKLNYTNFNASLVANGIDEISFEVHKYVDGKKCAIWDSLQDLKVVHVEGYGKFEISVNYTDNTETTKSVHGQSLEVELGQISLHEFHVNDEVDLEMNDYVPTVFWDTDRPERSLLHRVLADKAPHWSWGKVTSKIALDEESKPESSSTFQRTYTADGETIYDFLTGTVAEESNVIFEFDTFHRVINCYSLCDCIDQETGEVICKGIGEDTNVLVSKNKLANEISISSNKDSVKNCFKIEGGDDVISDMVRAVSMTGSNYINVFSEFQLNDMSKELRKKLIDYQDKISDQELQNQYYGENGIYTRICKAYEDLSYYESSMMPNVEIKETTAEEQYNLVKQQLINNHVGIYSFASYTSTGFTGVTNSVEDMANVYVDARYEVTIIDKNLKYEHSQNSTTGKWTGNIKVTHVGDETNFYPKTEAQENATFSVVIEDDKTEMLYTKQKIEKALSKGSMFDIDFEVAEMNETDMRNYFNQYSLNRLKSFAEGYNNCLSVLMQVGETTTSEVQSTLYDEYVMRYRIITNPPTSDNPNPTLGVLEVRQAQVDDINKEIDTLKQSQQNFQDDNKLILEDFLNEDGNNLYLEFCKYRREDTYSNSNYVSDGLSTAECIKKAKELIDVATKEAKKACMLQRTVSTSLNNLFALPEFEPLYDSFSLFNYIRVRTEDELLKLRLIGIEFNGDSIEEINVTFSDQIESIDGSLSDAQSIYQQMSSVATSFPSTARQAKQGESANKQFIDIYEHGMNATKSMITNNDNNEVTITNAGIIAKRMDDEGCYGEKQLRITGNGMYLTDDAWKSLKMAVGEILFNGDYRYGILAECIVGKMIAGENMTISNKNGTVEVTGDGITIFDINGNKVLYADTDGNLTMTGYVNAMGGKIGGLKVTSDYMAVSYGFDYESLPIDEASGLHYFDYEYKYIRDKNSSNEYDAVALLRCYYNTYFKAFYFEVLSNKSIDGSIVYSTLEIVNSKSFYVDCYTDYEDGYNESTGEKEPVLMYHLISSKGQNGSPDTSYYYFDIQGNVFLNGGAYSTSTLHTDGNTLYYFTDNVVTQLDEYPVYTLSGDLSSEHFTEKLLRESYDDGIVLDTINKNKILYYLEIEKEDLDGVGVVEPSIFIDFSEVAQSIFKSNEFTEVKQSTSNSVYIGIDGLSMGTALSYSPKDDTLVINNINSNFNPNLDATYSLGDSSYRWKNIYASTSVISTSDKNKKKNISYGLDEYIALFDKLKPCSFEFIDGTSGRTHIGYIAQDVEDALNELGISSTKFGGFCKSSINGVEIYSLRYDEFQGIYDAKIKQLEKRLEKLENYILKNNEESTDNE